ncbi:MULTISPECIES: hypothetical protein [unclassified Streptomyces]|uniref:hypothetical protein n=1 Tax=unclassified Streptomyces TaxID=2593676 RepID=UPI003D74899F
MLSLLPPVSPSLRLPAPWSVLDKPARHLLKEERTADARRWLWRWAQSAALPAGPADCERAPREVAGGALLRLAVVGLCCDWPDLAAGPAHRPPDVPPERVTRLWQALCLRLYRRPTVPVGPVLTTWNWRPVRPGGRTGRPCRPSDLLVPGALLPLYCWPSPDAAPDLARVLTTRTALLAASAGLPGTAAALAASGCPADRLVPVLEEADAVCATIRVLLAAARPGLAGGAARPPDSPVQRRVRERVLAPPPGPRGPAHLPGVPVGALPLALEAPWLLLGGGPARHTGPQWSPRHGEADREQARLLALLHTVGQDLAVRCRRHPAARAARTRALATWLTAAREHAHWTAAAARYGAERTSACSAGAGSPHWP